MINNKVFLYIYVIAILPFLGCRSNHLQSYVQYNLLKDKHYTESEIYSLRRNFRFNPMKHSNEYGSLLIWQISKNDMEFALKLSEIEELRDNITPKEAETLEKLFDIEKTIMNENKSVSMAENINTFDYFKKLKSTDIYSLRDFFLFCNQYEKKNMIFAYYNNISQKKRDRIEIIAKLHRNMAEEILKIPEVNRDNTFSMIEALDDIIHLIESATPDQKQNLDDYFWVGIPDKRKFCTPIQALVWMAEDGEFTESNNPLDEWWFDTVKSAWGNMKGERWDNPEDALLRMNHPILTNYWLRKNKSFSWSGRHYSFDEIYLSRTGDCKDFSEFSTIALRNSGWRVHQLLIRWDGLRSKGHWVGILKLDKYTFNPKLTYDFFDLPEIEKSILNDGEPLYWVVADGGGKGVERIKGPFKRDKDIAYSITSYYGGTLKSYLRYY